MNKELINKADENKKENLSKIVEDYKEILNKNIKDVIDRYKKDGVYKFQINMFNIKEVTIKKTDIQVIDFIVTEPPKEGYVCIIIYIGEKDLTQPNIEMMFNMTSYEHDWIKEKKDNEVMIDKNGIIVTEYDIDKAGFITNKQNKKTKKDK